MIGRSLWAALCLSALLAQGQDPRPEPPQTEAVRIESQGPLFIAPDGKQTRRGYVRVEMPGLFLMTADELSFDPEANLVVARGNIKVDYYTKLGVVEIAAREMEYSLADQSGFLTHVTAQFGNDFFFTGERLEVLNRGETFLIDEGTVTACNQSTPQWSLDIRSAKVKKEGYAVIRGVKFRVKSIAVVYLPYLIAPAMQERRSGLLLPDTGRSARNGAFFSQPFYWAPRRDLDFTFTPTYFDKGGWRLETEARYKPRLDLEGEFLGQFYWDRVLDGEPEESRPLEDGDPLDPQRFRVKWGHRQQYRGGLFNLQVEAGSDFSVDRDFLRDTESTRLRDYFYRGRYDLDLGRNALVLEADRLERILARNEQVLSVSKLPEVRLYQPNAPIGGGFYMRNYGYGSLFRLIDVGPSLYDNALLRLGLDGEISRAQNLNRFLHTRWGLGYKTGYYIEDKRSDSGLLTETGRNDLKSSVFAFFETVGPRLQNDYRVGGRKLVHYVDFILEMKVGAQSEDPFLDRIFLDDLDIRLQEQADGLQTAWKINSRLFLGEGAAVRPLLDIEITQDVDLDGGDDPSRPIDTRFRLINLGGFHANGIFQYDPDRGVLDTLSVYGRVTRRSWRGYAGYVKRRPGESDIDRESFIGISQLDFPAWRSSIRVAVDYDVDASDFKSQEFVFSRQGQCVGWSVSYIKSPFDSRGSGDQDFLQFTLSLRNLGDLGTRF